MLFMLPAMTFVPPIMLFMLFIPAAPALMLLIILPIGALLIDGLFGAVVIIGCCEKDASPATGGGFRANPDEPIPVEVDVAGGGGSEKEDDDVRFWAMLGRWSRDMDDMAVPRPLLAVLIWGGDAQGLEVAAEAVPQFRDVPAEEGWWNDGPVVVVW